MSVRQLTQMGVRRDVTDGYRCYCTRPSAFVVEVPTTHRSSFKMYLCETHMEDLQTRIELAVSSAK